MKKLGILALLLSLGLFSFGCTQTDTDIPAENGNGTDNAAPADAPADAPAEPASEG